MKIRRTQNDSVFRGFWSRGRIFENQQGEVVEAYGDRYRAVLNEFLFIKIKEENIGNIWFEQDGATCHTAEATLDVLRPVFEELRFDTVGLLFVRSRQR